MSAPAQNPFIGKTTRPSDSDLEKTLGRAKPLWDQLVAELASEHDVTTREWKSYSAKSGWALRLKRGKRTIVWLVPYDRCFQVAFIFGEKALTAIRQSDGPCASAADARRRSKISGRHRPSLPDQGAEGDGRREETGGHQAAALTRGRRSDHDREHPDDPLKSRRVSMTSAVEKNCPTSSGSRAGAVRSGRCDRHLCRRKLESALCQNCVRYPLKLRPNTVIYRDTPLHIAVAQSR